MPSTCSHSGGSQNSVLLHMSQCSGRTLSVRIKKRVRGVELMKTEATDKQLKRGVKRAAKGNLDPKGVSDASKSSQQVPFLIC